MVRNLNSPNIFNILRGAKGKTPNEEQGSIMLGITLEVDRTSRVVNILCGYPEPCLKRCHHRAVHWMADLERQNDWGEGSPSGYGLYESRMFEGSPCPQICKFQVSSFWIMSLAVRSSPSGVMDTNPSDRAPMSVPGSGTPVGASPPIQ